MQSNVICVTNPSARHEQGSSGCVAIRMPPTRLRVGDFRVFYDVDGQTVTVIAVLHKRETETFYRKE